MSLKISRARRLYSLLLFILLHTGATYGQSNTYRIEELSKPEKLLPTVSPENLFKTIDKKFLKLSVTGEVVDLGNRPVITGYLRAYQNHYPITISPDIIWLLICQGFSQHVNSNPEALRSMLVNFDSKKELVVTRNMVGTAGLSVFPWETVFPDFVKQITAYTGKELTESLVPAFSTTTPASRIAGQITIMESVKKFFNYKVIMVGCGIPEVTIEGSVEDWEKINKRLDYLSKYDLKWWTSELKPLIQKIIDTRRGKLDKSFWMNMVKYHKTGLYGSYDGIDGWLLKFYPYQERNGEGNGLTRSDFKEIKYIGLLPKEIASVPFIFEVQNGLAMTTASYKMEFWAGFMGVKQDKETFNIKPEIGWAVNMPGKK